LFFCFLGAQAHTYYISIIKKQQFSNARLVPHLSYNKKGGADAANKKGENKKQGEGGCNYKILVTGLVPHFSYNKRC